MSCTPSPLRVIAVVTAMSVGIVADARLAHAQESDAGASVEAAPIPAAPRARRRGLAVVSVPGVARDAAFPLARAVYASRLRPPGVDEESAHVLVGDAPAENAAPRSRELAELRGGLARDDAASRRLLAAVADTLGVEALLVVGLGDAPVGDAGIESPARDPRARLFLAESGTLDAARYEPDVAGTSAWKNTVESLERRFASGEPPRAAPAPAPAPFVAAAPAPARSETPSHKPFYASPWFWGTVGAAVLVGGFFLLSSRDTSDDAIRVRMQVPQ